MDFTRNIEQLEDLADDVLLSVPASLDEADRFHHALAQLVIHLNERRDEAEALLGLLEDPKIQQQIRDHIAAGRPMSS